MSCVLFCVSLFCIAVSVTVKYNNSDLFDWLADIDLGPPWRKEDAAQFLLPGLTIASVIELHESECPSTPLLTSPAHTTINFTTTPTQGTLSQSQADSGFGSAVIADTPCSVENIDFMTPLTRGTLSQSQADSGFGSAILSDTPCGVGNIDSDLENDASSVLSFSADDHLAPVDNVRRMLTFSSHLSVMSVVIETCGKQELVSLVWLHAPIHCFAYSAC